MDFRQGGDSVGFFGHWFVGLFVLVFWIVAIVAIVLLVRML
jgi:hypothetical protein